MLHLPEETPAVVSEWNYLSAMPGKIKQARQVYKRKNSFYKIMNSTNGFEQRFSFDLYNLSK